MAKIVPITEHFQHFLAEMKESFWGDLYGQTRRRGNSFSSCSRNESGTGSPGRDAMNGGEGGGASIATAITSGIS